MSVYMRYAAFSDVGLVRKNNQDGGYASSNMLMLADGMGGAAAGDVASSVTIAHLAALDGDEHRADDLLVHMRTTVEEAHADFRARAQEDTSLSGLGTTCICILRSGNKLAMVHIGDSRAYVLHDSHLMQVTHDHTLVQYLVDHGELTPEEAEHHPKRNVIMRALGDFPGDIELDESIREAHVGDRWLLCSDGLSGVVSAQTIEETLSTYEDIHACGERLIQLALAAGAPDNVTVVLGDIIDEAEVDEKDIAQEPIVVGSAAPLRDVPTRGGNNAAGQAEAFIKEATAEQEIDNADNSQEDDGSSGSDTRTSGSVSSSATAAEEPIDVGNHDSQVQITQRIILDDLAFTDIEEKSEQQEQKADLHLSDNEEDKKNDDHEPESIRGEENDSSILESEESSADTTDDEEENAGSFHKGKKNIRLLALVIATLLLIGGGAGIAGAYRWSQQQYYVHTNEGKVAIYKGVDVSLGFFELSHVYEVSDVMVDDLDESVQKRLKEPVKRDNLADARTYVFHLEEQVKEKNSSSIQGEIQ